MSLIIGADTKPDRERVLDKAVYDDVDDIIITKRNESFWDRQECTRHERLLEPVQDTQNFVPTHVDDTRVVGLSYPSAMDYKIMLSNRERVQFIQQWRAALVRCVTKTQWKIVIERYMNRAKDCPVFYPALKVVLEDRELLKVQESLPDERDPEDRRKRRDGDMERLKINWVMQKDFPLFSECPETLPILMLRGQVLESKHKNLRNTSRRWKVVQNFTYLEKTFPAMAFSTIHGICVARQVTEKVVQVSFQSQDYFLQEETGHSLLSCCISPDGKTLAVCNERSIYLISSGAARRVTLEAFMLITAMHLTDTELVFGTVHGHVYRLDVVKNKGMLKTWIADQVAINQIVRVGSKTVVQTIGSISLVESDFQAPNEMVQINTWRPMCIAVRGSKILVLNRSGALHLFSTVVREMFIELPPPEAFSVTVDIGVPWYKGACIGQDSQKVLALYPDGQLREITLVVPDSQQ